MTSRTTKFHKDGTITYWSAHEQHWCKKVVHVPDKDLGAMGEDEREQVINHLSLN